MGFSEKMELYLLTQSPLSVTTKWFLSFWLIFCRQVRIPHCDPHAAGIFFFLVLHWKKGIGIHFRSPLPNINTCILPPHQLCIPPLSDGQHCLTANREPRPWKMLFFHKFFFTAKKNLKYKVKNGWFFKPSQPVNGLRMTGWMGWPKQCWEG